MVGVTDHCFEDERIKTYTINKVAMTLRDELKMCSHSVKSVLRNSSPMDFQWGDLLNELDIHAPTLMSILNYATQTRHERQNRNGVKGISAAILLKFRFDKMSVVQKLVSCILYAGHSGKQVSKAWYIL